MFLRPHHRRRGNQTHTYWSLTETVQTERGARQRVVAYLGSLEEDLREATLAAAEKRQPSTQRSLFGEDRSVEPDWVEIDTRSLRVERVREFGGPWLGLEILHKLGLPEFMERAVPAGRAEIPWAAMALVLILGRLCKPGSELSIAEHWYRHSALPDLLGIPIGKVNDDRLYRALDRLLPAKVALERHLKERMGELFGLDYDLLLYDVTSTFFEGQAVRNPQAQRGYSRDQRSDCKQVCIALIVTRDGMPLGYEVFDGNRNDATTVEEIVSAIEEKHGQADRIWVMDRGMVSEENLEFLREEGRRYILGASKNQTRRWEAELGSDGWERVREGLEVKLCRGPDGAETFILCRSTARKDKDQAIRQRAVERFEKALAALDASCRKRTVSSGKIHERIGRLRERYSRASRVIQTEVVRTSEGKETVQWKRRTDWEEWSTLADGCYVLRTNVNDWSGEDLWKAYIQLTGAEAAFQIQKQDLALRPVWHQTEERVQAHILVCFLAYVVWKALGRMCQSAGLGHCPRRVLEEIAQVRLVDVVMRTRGGVELRRRCVTRPDEHQAILLKQLGVTLPSGLSYHDPAPKKVQTTAP